MADLENLIQECGVLFYDSEIVNENSNKIFRVYITKNGGVNLEDCENVSKILSPIFDVNPPVDGNYILEVSSPGIERKLTKIEHFSKSVGEKVKIELTDKGKISGKILEVYENLIKIENQEKEIDFNKIKKAKIFIDWN